MGIELSAGVSRGHELDEFAHAGDVSCCLHMPAGAHQEALLLRNLSCSDSNRSGRSSCCPVIIYCHLGITAGRTVLP